MMRRSKLAGAGIALALSAGLAVLPAAAASAAPPASAPTAVAQAPSAPTALPVTGDGFVGEISDLTVSTVDGVLQVSGVVEGTLDGVAVPATDFTTVIEDVQVSQACDILNLDLGPLNLDVLGLVVDLSDVQLDITAVPGAGNLLGNLLCAVAGLLDRGGPLLGLSSLLNRVLTGLGL
jgi:hypothetical protein